jgi:hypothetical protein
MFTPGYDSTLLTLRGQTVHHYQPPCIGCMRSKNFTMPIITPALRQILTFGGPCIGAA